MNAPGASEWIVQVPCGNCGARDFEVTRPGWANSLRDWLGFGGPWRPTRRVCRRCGDLSSSGSFGSFGSFGTYAPSRWAWWSVPIRLVQTVRQRRTMIPVPATYLAAMVVGAGLGVAAQLALGWSWWLVAAGVVAAVWLVFLSTAFWGEGGSRRSLATEVLRVVSPRRAIKRDHQQEVDRFRAAPFPLYGLPASWSGPRQFGGWEGGWSKGQRPVTIALSLDHGDPLADQGPQLRVEVRVEQVDIEQVMTVRIQGQRSLAKELWVAAAPPAHDVAEHWDQIAAVGSRPEPAWSQLTIPVDGRPVAFAWLAEGRHWAARAEVDDRTLTLHARDLPVESVELLRVTELKPYIEGQRRLEQAWACHHAQEH
jgi:hypothetical protein